jgi:hypothetical protein
MAGPNVTDDRSPDDPTLLIDEQVRNHNAVQVPDAEPGVLAAYRTDVLLLPAAAAADVGGLNDLLAEGGLGRPLGDPLASAGPFTPVRVEADAALDVWRILLDRAPAAGISPDRLISLDTLTGAPGPTFFLAGRKQGHGDAGRVPVALRTAAPPWRPITGRAERRPVVAVLDTGVDAHPWWAAAPEDDLFVVNAEKHGWRPMPQPLPAGAVRRYTGHGTFIAGLIRQEAPDARVLSVRIMHDDGVVYASEVLRALTWLRGMVAGSAPDPFVDVVVMAFGYHKRSPEDDVHTAELRTLIRSLADAGVQVVASAGNQGSKEQTFPAAFAADPDPPAKPVISVGALNPNGTDAHYSNHGGWIKEKVVGTGVISTMPDVNGDEPPPLSTFFPKGVGVTVDPDDFRGGFARWSGTSFAAAIVAGRRAQEILDGAPEPTP